MLKKLIILPVIVSLFFFENCILDDSEAKTELEKLPLATQEGKGTFGCLINGKAWSASSPAYAPANYQNSSLGFSGTKYAPTESIGLDLTEGAGDGALTIGTYSLLPAAQYNPLVSVYRFNCRYGGSSYRDDVISGEVSIKKFDKVKYIGSGSFEFVIVHPGCDTLKVTDGRFDIAYAP